MAMIPRCTKRIKGTAKTIRRCRHPAVCTDVTDRIKYCGTHRPNEGIWFRIPIDDEIEQVVLSI